MTQEQERELLEAIYDRLFDVMLSLINWLVGQIHLQKQKLLFIFLKMWL